MRYTGIRLLLVFVATNAAMILMLVSSMGSDNAWLSYILPGQFHPGGDNSGYWVFFSLWLLVDAVTSMGVALYMLLPALGKITAADMRHLKEMMLDRPEVPPSARRAVLDAIRDGYASVRQELFWGRMVLLLGAFFLVLAFSTMTFSFSRALPQAAMFVPQCDVAVEAGTPSCTRVAIGNAAVRGRDVELFTIDQIAGTVLLGAPEVYGIHIGSLANNPYNQAFAHFVFGFRTLLGLEVVLLLFSIIAGYGYRPEAIENGLADTHLSEPG